MKRFNVLCTGENGQNWDHLPLRRGLNKTYPLSWSGLIKKTLFNPPYKVLLSESKIELEIKETSGIFWAVRLRVSCGSTYVRLGDYRLYVVGADGNARGGGEGGQGCGGLSQGSLSQSPVSWLPALGAVGTPPHSEAKQVGEFPDIRDVQNIDNYGRLFTVYKLF